MAWLATWSFSVSPITAWQNIFSTRPHVFRLWRAELHDSPCVFPGRAPALPLRARYPSSFLPSTLWCFGCLPPSEYSLASLRPLPVSEMLLYFAWFGHEKILKVQSQTGNHFSCLSSVQRQDAARGSEVRSHPLPHSKLSYPGGWGIWAEPWVGEVSPRALVTTEVTPTICLVLHTQHQSSASSPSGNTIIISKPSGTQIGEQDLEGQPYSRIYSPALPPEKSLLSPDPAVDGSQLYQGAVVMVPMTPSSFAICFMSLAKFSSCACATSLLVPWVVLGRPSLVQIL